MSPPGDDLGRMPDDMLTDEAIEAFFAGSPDPRWERDELLATLADDIDVVMSSPAPVPDHALRQLFWQTGAAPDATHAAVGAGSVAHHLTTDGRRRRPFRGRLRVVAGAALGTAVALSGVGVAGAAGVLPAPAQRAVASVVEAVTPFQLPYPAGHASRPSDGGGAVGTGQQTVPQGPATGRQPGPNTPAPPVGAQQAPSTPPGASSPPPTGPESRGLDRAGQTPAGPRVPPVVPGPGASDGGNPPAPGPGRAGQTPASVPPWVPGPPAPELPPGHSR